MELLVFSTVFVPILLGIILYLYDKIKWSRLFFINFAIIFAALVGITTEIIEVVEYKTIIGGWNKYIGIGVIVNKNILILMWFSFFVFLSVSIYSYKVRAKDVKYLFFFLILQGGFNGFLISNDLYNLFVMMDLITIISAILIIYQKDSNSLRAGIYYVLFNTVGMCFYLIGVILIYYEFGTLNISFLSELIEMSEFTTSMKLSLAMIVTSLGIKSAIFPVYDWLPRAHSASPTEVSALLSGLLVKTGIIGIMKIGSYFEPFELNNMFLVMGIITSYSGAIFALSNYNIKKILSYQTISKIGVIMIGYSINETVGTIFLVNHGIFKMILFFGAGNLIETYDTKDIRNMRGYFAKDPISSLVMLLAMASIVGTPLFSGYVSKYLIKSGLDNQVYIMIFNGVSILTIATFLRLIPIFRGNDWKEFKIKMGMKNIALLISATVMMAFGLWTQLYMYIYDVKFSFIKHFSGLIEFMLLVAIGFAIKCVLMTKGKGFMRKLRYFAIEFPDAIKLLIFFFAFVYLFV